MGLMDKFLGYMKLGDDEDDGYYDDEYDDYDEAPVEKKPISCLAIRADILDELPGVGSAEPDALVR